MVNEKKQIFENSNQPLRRRGRPAGKNRIPLSQEERRARNAQYERERRNETAEAMCQLIEAVSCDPNISNAELLATVVSRIQRASRKKSEDISDLERINANLEAQIATLKDRLGLDDASLELLDNDDPETVEPHSNFDTTTNTSRNHDNLNLRKQTKKLKRSEWRSSESMPQEKRTKKQSETCSIDSGIEMRGHMVSPPACVQTQDTIQYPSTKQPPVEISEEHEYVSQAHIELQTELYNQIYNSESQCCTESVTEWNVGTSTQTIPCMETLTRSLIVVPAIIPPQQEQPVVQEQTQSELVNLQNAKNELPSDLSIVNECNFLQQDEQPTLDFLTDSEKNVLASWIKSEFLETSEFADDSQMQVRSYPIDDMLSGYS